MTECKIAETLHELRIRSGLTQKELSQKLNISRQTYANYENGKRIPNLEISCEMADFFHVTLIQLVYGLHQTSDAFSTLPLNYQELLRVYDRLSSEGQKQLTSYGKYLGQQERQAAGGTPRQTRRKT